MEAETLKEGNARQKNQRNPVYNKHASLPIPSCSAVIRSIFASLLSSPDSPGADVPVASSACCSAAILSLNLVAELVKEQSLQCQRFDSQMVGRLSSLHEAQRPLPILLVHCRQRSRFKVSGFSCVPFVGFCV